MSPRDSGLTRRQAFQLGTAAGLSVMFGVPAAADAGAGRAPAHLRRSSYTPLVGDRFGADEEAWKLVEVADLAGAAGEPGLRGHEEAFVLRFEGAGGGGGTIRRFRHPALGTFALFASPVGARAGRSQRQEVVVDRAPDRLQARKAARRAETAPRKRRRRRRKRARLRLRLRRGG